jgi:hypothetical protein
MAFTSFLILRKPRSGCLEGRITRSPAKLSFLQALYPLAAMLSGA